MKDKTILWLGIAGLGGYILYKSKFFQATGDILSGTGAVIGGAGELIGSVGYGAGELLTGTAQSARNIAAAAVPYLNPLRIPDQGIKSIKGLGASLKDFFYSQQARSNIISIKGEVVQPLPGMPGYFQSKSNAVKSTSKASTFNQIRSDIAGSMAKTSSKLGIKRDTLGQPISSAF